MNKKLPCGHTRDKILAVLRESDGMTRAEIEAAVGLPREHVSNVISRLSKPQAKLPKRIYISHYVNDQEGAKRYPRAVYCIGDNQDAKKPKTDTAARRREWAKLRLARAKNSSVFNLGVPRQILYKRGKMEQAA